MGTTEIELYNKGDIKSATWSIERFFSHNNVSPTHIKIDYKEDPFMRYEFRPAKIEVIVGDDLLKIKIKRKGLIFKKTLVSIIGERTDLKAALITHIGMMGYAFNILKELE